jgi:Lipoxygenase
LSCDNDKFAGPTAFEGVALAAPPIGKPFGLPRVVMALMAVVALGLVAAIARVGVRLSQPAAIGIRTIVIIVVIIAIIAVLYWLVFRVHRLPLSLIGLSGATNLPAIPIWLSELPSTVLGLLGRSKQLEQAVNGLSTRWTIGEVSENAYTFMGMEYAGASGRSVDPRTRLALERPDQFAMGWTTLGGVQANATRDWLAEFAGALADPAEATKAFWPTIARFGLAYNLIILRRVGPDDAQFKAALGADWTPRMESVWQAGNLYVIDMTLFAKFPANVANFTPRFTPGTLTLLERDPAARALAPFTVRVSDSSGKTVQYADRDPAWPYALQAAKTSVAVWGIWLGHVYHFHIVTAAMQMTMFQLLRPAHPVRQAFGRQSDYLIGFDQFLLLDWSIAPPTSFTSSRQFLALCDTFAIGRNFFDDDPRDTIARLGLRREDFTRTADWDEYPVVRDLLTLYDITAKYVGTVVAAFYPDDASVAGDDALHRWIAASGARDGGNVRGLPAMTTQAALKRVLTSLIYRVTAHGSSRLNQAANPALSFTANFPPCLQNTTIPPASTPVVFKTGPASPPGAMSLADFLPNTGTIGELTAFLFTFIYSAPYKPFIPLEGIHQDQSFTGRAGAADLANQALVQYRRDLEAFIDRYAAESNVPGVPAQIHQWELSIET